jgi:hypothetical protein
MIIPHFQLIIKCLKEIIHFSIKPSFFDMQNINWQDDLRIDTDISTLFDIYYSKISQIIDKHIPLKQLSICEMKFASKPWITSGLKVSISVKNKFYKKYLKTKSCYDHSKFKYYRNKLNHLLKISKKNYYNDYFLKNNSNSKRTWKGIKQIIHFRTKSNPKLNKIVLNNMDITDPLSIANEFNNYFSNVGKNLANIVPHTDKSFTDYLTSPLQNSFFMYSVTATEIELEISKLKNGKSTGPYSIPIAILKQIKHIISEPLAILYNMSFTMVHYLYNLN